MSPRDPRLQAAALRLAAERVEALASELADAIANDMASHPEELAAIEAHAGALPQWMAEELDRRDREDAGTEDDGDVVMARLLAKHSPCRQPA
jgi:acyl-CoA reductase-like NAD-dependent aldehyde dehydrogenase